MSPFLLPGRRGERSFGFPCIYTCFAGVPGPGRENHEWMGGRMNGWVDGIGCTSRSSTDYPTNSLPPPPPHPLLSLPRKASYYCCSQTRGTAYTVVNCACHLESIGSLPRFIQFKYPVGKRLTAGLDATSRDPSVSVNVEREGGKGKRARKKCHCVIITIIVIIITVLLSTSSHLAVRALLSSMH